MTCFFLNELYWFESLKEVFQFLQMDKFILLEFIIFLYSFSTFKVCSDITSLVSNFVICTFSLINLVRSFITFIGLLREAVFPFIYFVLFYFHLFLFFTITGSFLLFSLWLALLDLIISEYRRNAQLCLSLCDPLPL